MKKMQSSIYCLLFVVVLYFGGEVYGQISPGNVHPTSLNAWFIVEDYHFTPSWKNTAINKALPEVRTGNIPKKGPLWNYHPTVKFNGKQGNNGFRSKIDDVRDILEPDGGTLYAVLLILVKGRHTEG